MSEQGSFAVRVRSGLVAILLVVGVGCADQSESQNPDSAPTPTPSLPGAVIEGFGLPPFEIRSEIDWVGLPADLTVEIMREDIVPSQVRIMDLRLSRPVQESVLETIAGQVLRSDTASYPTTYIVYYLPGMEAGQGGWATSHYSPELEVRILGERPPAP